MPQAIRRTIPARSVGVAAAVALVVALVAACGGQDPAPATNADAPTVTATTSADAASPTPADTPTPTPTAPTLAQLGSPDGYTYPDGVRVFVPTVTVVPTSDTAAGINPGEIAVQFIVNIENNGTAPLDVSTVYVQLRAGTVGRQVSSSVFDSENGLGTFLTGTLSPGRQATGDYVFAILPEEAGQLDLEISLFDTLDRDSALFTGSVTP